VLGLQIEVGRDRIAQWPGPRQLTVLAEQATMFYDVMTDGIVNQVRERVQGTAHCSLADLMCTANARLLLAAGG
jgi:hypothetical protein